MGTLCVGNSYRRLVYFRFKHQITPRGKKNGIKILLKAKAMILSDHTFKIKKKKKHNLSEVVHCVGIPSATEGIQQFNCMQQILQCIHLFPSMIEILIVNTFLYFIFLNLFRRRYLVDRRPTQNIKKTQL